MTTTLVAYLSELYVNISYTFRQPLLLGEALTHRSAAPGNNERLEFIGDALLNFFIAEYLFKRYPRAREGELSRLRASLVNGETLAELARNIRLDKWLRLGPGEIKSGVYQRDSILADAMEAIIGAVYFDGGLEACRNVVLTIYARFTTRLSEETSVDGLKDPKTLLQEYLQRRQQSLPIYSLIAVSGEPHMQNFTVECIVDTTRVTAKGKSRRKAEQEAAKLLLERLKKNECF